MIDGISVTGRYMSAHGGHDGTTYINGMHGAQGVGNMRYNTSSQRMEVFDGTNWIIINSTIASVGLTGEAESLLDWIKQKRDEERTLEYLAEENPTIKDLVNQIKEKQHQVKMIQTLLKSSGNEGQELMGS
jgi:hypothetical protein